MAHRSKRVSSSSLKTMTAVAAAVIGGVFLFNRYKTSSRLTSHYVGGPVPPGGDYSFTRAPGYNRKDY